MKIFNWKQADIFIKRGAKVTGTGLGNRNKTYIEFEDNQILQDLMIRWKAKEF
jgi:hypothetical protein